MLTKVLDELVLLLARCFWRETRTKSRANIFLILWETSSALCLKFMYSAHPSTNTSFHVFFFSFYSWKTWRWVLLACNWKTSSTVSHGGQAAQIPVDFNPSASSKSSFLFSLANNSALSPLGSRGHVHAPCLPCAPHSFSWAWRTPTRCTFPSVGHWFQSLSYMLTIFHIFLKIFITVEIHIPLF